MRVTSPRMFSRRMAHCWARHRCWNRETVPGSHSTLDEHREHPSRLAQSDAGGVHRPGPGLLMDGVEDDGGVDGSFGVRRRRCPVAHQIVRKVAQGHLPEIRVGSRPSHIGMAQGCQSPYRPRIARRGEIAPLKVVDGAKRRRADVLPWFWHHCSFEDDLVSR